MMKVGIHNAYANKDWYADYSDVINRVSAIGFDVLEANPTTFLEMPRQKRVDLKKLVEDKGMEFVFSFGLDQKYDLSSEDENVRQNGIRFIKQILAVISEMGADTYAGCNYTYWPYNYKTGSRDRRKLADISLKSMKELIKVAEDLEIDYALEVFNRFEQIILNTAKEAVEFVKRIDSPRAKINLDTFHMNIEEDSFTEAIYTAKDYLVDIHIGERNRRFPGMGDMPWDDIFGALKAINYDKYIVMEPFMTSGGEVGEDVYLWRDLTDNATREEMDAHAKKSLQFIREKTSK